MRQPDLAGPQWKNMSPLQQIERCHSLAREAEQMALAQSHPVRKTYYSERAACWRARAIKLEMDYARPRPDEQRAN